MGSLNPVDVNIIVGEYGATYGRYAYGLVGKAHFSDYLGQQLVDYAVAAARAVVHVHFIEKLGGAIYLVLGADYILDFHR